MQKQFPFDGKLSQTGVPLLTNADVGEKIGETSLKPAETRKYGWGETKTVVNIAGFNGGLLTGIAGFPFDHGDALGTNAAEVHSFEWLPQIDSLVPGLRGRLPSILPTNSIVGPIAKYWQEKYGFSPDTKIINWTGDNPASMVGQGIVGGGQVGISLGTSFTAYTHITRTELDKTLESPIGNVFGTPTGEWMKLICFQNGALALSKIRDDNIKDEEAIGRLAGQGIGRSNFFTEDDWSKKIDEEKWKIFNEEVGQAPVGNNGAMMITQNTQEEVIRVPYRPDQPFTRNLDYGKASRPEKLRAAVEGQMYFLKVVADKVGLDVKEINLTGGASKNPVIRQIMADVFNANVNVLQKGHFENEPVSLGAAITAAKTVADASGKQVPWEEAVKGLVALDDQMTTKPDATNAATYAKHLPEFEVLVNEAMASKDVPAPAKTEEKEEETPAPVAPPTEKTIDYWGKMPGELLEKMRGGGRNWFLGINSSTQSVTFTVVDFDEKEIIWQWREKFDAQQYSGFGAPKGFLPNQDNLKRFHTDPLMLATALDNGVGELRDAFKAYGWGIGNIRAISGAGQQHGTVYYNDKAEAAFGRLDSNRPLAEQIEPVLARKTAPIWMDKTTEKEGEQLERFFGGPDALRHATGSNAQLRFGMLQWMRFAQEG